MANLKITTVCLPVEMFNILDSMVDADLIVSRSAAIRDAIRLWLRQVDIDEMKKELIVEILTLKKTNLLVKEIETNQPKLGDRRVEGSYMYEYRHIPQTGENVWAAIEGVKIK